MSEPFKTYWLSSKQMTVGVDVDMAGHIRIAPPIVKEFELQLISDLIDWMSQQEDFEYKVL